MNWEPALSVIALIVAILALGLSVYFWRRQFRPIITASVKTRAGGNQAICYDFVLQNSGAIPAKNVRIEVDSDSLDAAFASGATEEAKRKWLACFDDGKNIGIIQNGHSISCSFGTTSRDDSGFWKYGSIIRITISYQGWIYAWFCGPYRENQTIEIVDSDSFTGYHWA